MTRIISTKCGKYLYVARCSLHILTSTPRNPTDLPLIPKRPPARRVQLIRRLQSLYKLFTRRRGEMYWFCVLHAQWKSVRVCICVTVVLDEEDFAGKQYHLLARLHATATKHILDVV